VARIAVERKERTGAEVRPSRTGRADGAASRAWELDRVIHDRARLAILSALAVNEELSFAELKGLLGMTDGNLSVHARKLEEAGYLSCAKSFRQRVPLTEYRLTRAGRRAFTKYLDHMEALIRAAREE